MPTSIKSFPLNKAQLKAVNTLNGPVLVVAGAGTGKTRIIEYRVLNLILHNVNPDKVLLLTFTRKAAREMLSRAAAHDIRCKKVEGGTFHSFAYKIIQKYHKKLGFTDFFSFIDESDAEQALALLSEKLGFRDKKERFPKKQTLRTILSMSFNRSEKIADILHKDYPQFLQIYREIEELKDSYIKYKLQRSLIDYDDMLLYLKILLENEKIREKLSLKYQYIMVDEFQDTNKLQGEIVYLLGRAHGNVLAVGDDTQSIYSFRGAYYKNMFDFPKYFPKVKIIKLEENYRSTQPILDLANAIIEEEKHKYTKVLHTAKEGREKPKFLFFRDATAEAGWIAGRIKQFYDQGVSLHKIGVLYRSNHLSLPLQIELAKLNIPFIVYGGIRFIETAHVKDVLAFLRILYNHKDELAWHRILSLLEGIGVRTTEKIITELFRKPDLDANLSNFKSKKFYRKLIQLIVLVRKLRRRNKNVSVVLEDTLYFYYPLMKEKFDDYLRREDDLRALVGMSQDYKNLREFLVDFVVLDAPKRSVGEVIPSRKDEHPAVLSTIHSAKGLEWENVFIVGLSDGSLPVTYALDDEEAIEEECRLLYVAITRAKRHLYLSIPACFSSAGRAGTVRHDNAYDGILTFNRICRFLNVSSVLSKLDMNLSRFLSESPYAGEQDEDIIYDDIGDIPYHTKSSLYKRILKSF